MSTVNLQHRLNDLFGYIRQGKIIEGFKSSTTEMRRCRRMRTLRPSVRLPTSNEKGSSCSVAKWSNGKIVYERFYYDTGKK